MTTPFQPVTIEAGPVVEGTVDSLGHEVCEFVGHQIRTPMEHVNMDQPPPLPDGEPRRINFREFL